MEKKGRGNFHEAKSSQVCDMKISVDLDDAVITDFGVTKSEIELNDMENFNKVTDLPPEDESKGDIGTLSQQRDKEEAENLKNEGNSLMRLGNDIDGAVNAYSKAIALQRNNHVIYNNRAAAHMINADFEEALDDCNTSLLIKNNLKAHCRKGQALGRLNRYTEALESVERALEMRVDDAESIAVKATLLEDQVDFEAVTKVNSIKNDGNTLLEKQDFIGAVRAYTMALSLSNNNYVIYNNRAVAHLMNEDYSKAIEDCDKSLTIKKNSKAYCRKAQALRKTNMIEDALDMVNLALKINKQDAEACRIKEELTQDIEEFENDAMSFYNIQERCAEDIVMECLSHDEREHNAASKK
jgi:tetratricopeptide (TPR) repeat protein